MKNKLIYILISFLNLGSAWAVTESYEAGKWSPYVVGALIGMLTWLTFRFSDKAIGASSAYAAVSGFIGKLFAKEHTLKLSYFKKNPPKLNWELVFVGSTIVGSFIAALTGGEFVIRWIPELWENTFGGDSGGQYALSAFGGGILMAFGARLAGGCTSGHGISGTLQLSVASWVTVICFFISGILVVRLFY